MYDGSTDWQALSVLPRLLVNIYLPVPVGTGLDSGDYRFRNCYCYLRHGHDYQAQKPLVRRNGL